MIDSHVSVILNSKCYSNKKDYTLSSCQREMISSKIKHAVVIVNPAIKAIFCKQDNNHKVRFEYVKSTNKIRVVCLNCKQIVYFGENPYRKLNEELITEVDRRDREFFPIVFLPLIPEIIEEEIKYFETKYKGSFFGYKLQPSLSNREILEIEKFDSNLAIFIHSGKDPVADPLKTVSFASKYSGDIVISHFAKFNKEVFLAVNNLNNLYIDTSPASIMFNAIKRFPELLFDTNFLGNIKDTQSLYRKIVEIVNERKIVYGSDYPVSSIYKESKILLESNLKEETIKNITENNILRILKINNL